MSNVITEGSGNVFKDLGLSDPRGREAKARIALHIEHIMQGLKLTQAQAAQRMGLSQPDVSNIVRGRLRGFTLDRLFQGLDALNQQIEISIRPRGEGQEERTVVLYR